MWDKRLPKKISFVSLKNGGKRVKNMGEMLRRGIWNGMGSLTANYLDPNFHTEEIGPIIYLSVFTFILLIKIGHDCLFFLVFYKKITKLVKSTPKSFNQFFSWKYCVRCSKKAFKLENMKAIKDPITQLELDMLNRVPSRDFLIAWR